MAVDLNVLKLTDNEVQTFGNELEQSKDFAGAQKLLEYIGRQQATISEVQSLVHKVNILDSNSVKGAYSELAAIKANNATSSKDLIAQIETSFPSTVKSMQAKIKSLDDMKQTDIMLDIDGFTNTVNNILQQNQTAIVTEGNKRAAQQQAASQTQPQQQPQTTAQPTPPSNSAQVEADLRNSGVIAEKRLTPHTATARDKEIYKPIETNSTSGNDHNLAMFRFASMVNNAYRKEEITASITKLAGMGTALKIIDDKSDPRDIKDPIERAQATQAIAAYNKEMDSIAENIAASYGVSKEDARKQVDTFIDTHKLSEGWFSARPEGEYGSPEIFAKVANYQKQIDAVADKFAVGADGKYDEKKLDEAIAKLDEVIKHEKTVVGSRYESDNDERVRTSNQDALFAVLNDGKTNAHLELQGQYQSLIDNVATDSPSDAVNLSTAEAMKDRLVAIKAEHAPISQTLAQGQGKTTQTPSGDRTPPRAEQVVDAETVKTALQNVRTDLAKLTDGKGANDKDAMKDAVNQMQVAGVITTDKAAELQKTIDAKFGNSGFVRTSDAQEMQKQFNQVIAQAQEKGKVTRLDVAVLASTIENVVQDDTRDVKSIIAAGDTKQKDAVALVDVPQDIQVAGNFTPPSTPAPATKAEDKQAERS